MIVCACQKCLDTSSALYEMIFCDWKKIMFKTLIKKDSSLSKIEANMWNALLVEVPVSSNGSGSISIMPSCGCSSGCTIHLSFPADPRWLSLSWTGKWKQNPHILINDMAKSRFTESEAGLWWIDSLSSFRVDFKCFLLLTVFHYLFVYLWVMMHFFYESSENAIWRTRNFYTILVNFERNCVPECLAAKQRILNF